MLATLSETQNLKQFSLIDAMQHSKYHCSDSSYASEASDGESDQDSGNEV